MTICIKEKPCRWAVVTVLAVLFAILFWAKSVAAENTAYFDPLVHRLIADGFDSGMINKLYGRPQVRFETRGISTFFTYSESRLNYDQFLSWRSIRKAEGYLKTHKKELQAAEHHYGVDRHIITAIILVETKLGTYLGNRMILNTLSTMASLSNPEVRELFWNRIDTSRRFKRDRFDKKADAKSKWAYSELKAFLKYTAAEKLDPADVVGSFAGAMGIAQFMPSNALKLAKDGNMDGRVDLFNHSDAIASVANYLKHHGWKPDITRKEAYRILLRYNYSKYYVKTIQAIADKLKS